MFEVGDIVYIKRLRIYGQVIEKKHDQYKVLADCFTISTNGDEIEKHLDKPQLTEIPKQKRDQLEKQFYRKLEFSVDLHGFTTEQTEIAVKDLIEEAILYQAAYAFIVHGKGTGTLRIKVQQMLKYYKQKGIIRDFQFAKIYDGGHGATVIYF